MYTGTAQPDAPFGTPLPYRKATAQSKRIALSGFQWLYDLDWSPATNMILVLTRLENGKRAIWTVHPDGSQQRKVVEDDMLDSPRWSPAGDSNYFFRSKSSISDPEKLLINPKSGEATGAASKTLSGLQVGTYFTLSADGSRLAFIRDLRYSNLWLAELSGGEKETMPRTKPLTNGTSILDDPSISPDGKWVAYTMGSPSANVFKMLLEGGTPVQLTFSQAIHRSPAWSADGTRIAFGSNEGGSNKVWIVDAVGGTPKQFAKTQLSSSLGTLGAPGSNILYQKVGNRNFLFLDPVTEHERPLVRDESVGWIFNPIISPDGMKVAVYWNRDRAGIWVISLTDGSATILTKDTGYPIGWSKDGSTIYRRYKGIICAQAIDGGTPGTFVTMPGEILSASMNPDRKKFVCNIGESKSDVWVVENFDPAQKK